MGLKKEVIARVYLPVIISTGMILFFYYMFGVLVFKDVLNETINEIKENGLELFQQQSLILTDYLEKNIEISTYYVALAQNLTQKYFKDSNIMKSNFTTDFFINALEYTTYSSMDGNETKCKKNYCSMWYLNDHILDINDLDDISKRFLIYSTLIQTVYRQSIKHVPGVFIDSTTGYGTGLTVIYPTIETTLYTDYDCNLRSDTCRYLPCNNYQLNCRYWYSETMKLADKNFKDDVVILKPYNYVVGNTTNLLHNSCIRLYEDEKIIGNTCITINPTAKLIEIFHDINQLINQDVSYLMSDIYGYVLIHPKLLEIEDSDLIVVSTPDIIYETSSKEKQEFSEKYYYYLERMKYEEEQQFFFMKDEVEYIMRLINSTDSRGIPNGVAGFYIDYGLIEKKSIMIEQELHDMLQLGLVIVIAIIMILTVLFGICTYCGLVYFSLSIDECAEELRLIKEGEKLWYEAKPYAYNKEITHLTETFSKLSIIYVLNNDSKLTDLDTTIQIYEQAYLIFSEIKNYKGIYAVGYHLGMLYMQKNSYEKAIEVFETCIRIVRSKKTDSESLGRVLSCILQAYYMVDNSNSMLLFRNFEDVLHEKDLKIQLLLECDYIEFNNLPLRSYIQTVKANIHREKDHILLQKYYYYKVLMYSHDRNYAHALKAIEKSLKAGTIFDPQIRKLILKKLQEILSEFDISWRWVERYKESLKDQPVDIVILSAICPGKAQFYFEMMRRIYQYQTEEDSITHFICNSEEILYDQDPAKYSIRKFKDSDRSYFFEGLNTAISLMRDIREQRARSNLWIVILNDKEFNMNPTAIKNLQTASRELCISYTVITTQSQEAFQKITDKAARVIQYENFDDEIIERMVKFIFCMRYELNTFISERFLYATYLI